MPIVHSILLSYYQVETEHNAEIFEASDYPYLFLTAL